MVLISLKKAWSFYTLMCVIFHHHPLHPLYQDLFAQLPLPTIERSCYVISRYSFVIQKFMYGKSFVYVSDWATIWKTHILESMLHPSLKGVANCGVNFLKFMLQQGK